MINRFAGTGFRRPVCTAVCAAATFALGAAVNVVAVQTPAPTTPAPIDCQAEPGRPAGPAPATPAAARGRASNDGPVRDASGAVIGFTNMAEIPGTPWRIHDASRPHPHVVTPGASPGAPSSDAIVLFDGTSLSKWGQMQDGRLVDAKWPVRDGYFETATGTGSLITRDKFGDVQLHLEFSTPNPPRGASQDRGNSGIKFMDRYEVQVLDSYDSVTYADGQAGAIYGEYPPLVNVARKPGEWQTYDIVFEAPKFNGTVLVMPAYVTVFWNGVIVQHRRPVMGPTSVTQSPHAYIAHDAELPLTLQDHAHPVRYRNIWIRRLAGYDLPEAR